MPNRNAIVMCSVCGLLTRSDVLKRHMHRKHPEPEPEVVLMGGKCMRTVRNDDGERVCVARWTTPVRRVVWSTDGWVEKVDSPPATRPVATDMTTATN